MRHPDCDRDPAECRIRSNGSTSTLLAWSPTYDGNGKRTDAGDPNTHSTYMGCSTCERRWTEHSRYGQVTIT